MLLCHLLDREITKKKKKPTRTEKKLKYDRQKCFRCFQILVVEVVVSLFEVLVGLPRSAAGTLGRTGRGFLRETEVLTESSALLQRRSEHLVLPDILIGNRPAGESHGLLKVSLADLSELFFFVDVHGTALQWRSLIIEMLRVDVTNLNDVTEAKKSVEQLSPTYTKWQSIGR